MIRSIIKNKTVTTALAVLFWLGVWQAASNWLNSSLLLVSPIQTVKTLFSLLGESAFWSSVLFSFSRIALGFAAGAAAGVILSAMACAFAPVRVLLSPFFSVVKSTPVASFIILALVWLNAKSLPVFISFLMVLPIVYTSCLEGLLSADVQMLEMARVYRLSFWKKVRAVYLPAAAPFFASACKLGLGLAWKSGIAAEVIALPVGSIGERLYEAKIFLATDELFAWTTVIIIVSVLFEKGFLLGLSLLQKRMER